MFNIRLKIVRPNDDVVYLNMMQEAESINIGAASLDYSIKKGNRFRGLEQGIGLQEAGRTMSFTIPVFEQQAVAGRKDIVKIISFYNSLLAGASSYQYFVEFNIEDEWYSAECKVTKNTALSIEYVNLVKSFGLTCTLIDNYFYSENYEEKSLNINTDAGLQEITYESLSDTISLLNCSISVTNQGGSAYIFYYVNSNYGLSFSDSGNRTDEPYVIEDYKVKRGDIEITDVTGIQPFIYPGKNIITLYTKEPLADFTIKYKKGLLL